jgi:dual specificity protein kinase YAK1
MCCFIESNTTENILNFLGWCYIVRGSILLYLVLLTDHCSCFSYRGDHLFHASTLTETSASTGHVTYDGYHNANYSQLNFQSRHGQPFQRYNHMTASYLRPMGNHHNGQPVWPNYGMAEPPPATMADGMPWGNISMLSFVCFI